MSRDITIFKHVIMHGIFMHQSYQIQKGYMFYGFARVWVDKSNTKLTRILIQISSFFILIKYVCTAKTFFVLFVLKLWSEMNRTTLGVGHFNNASGHFFANHIKSFHKIEDLMVILICPTF